MARLTTFLIALVLFLPLSAAVSDVKVQSAHNVAVIAYTAPNSAACSLKVADMGETDEPQPMIPISAGSQSSGTVTFTTHGLSHALFAGDVVYIDSDGPSQWNGWQTVTGAPPATGGLNRDQFTIASATSGTATIGKVGWLVHDVDTALFSGSDLDSRSGNYNRGRLREFEVGKAHWDVAASGKRISRALRAFARHVFTIGNGSDCGGDTYTGEFTTANIPFGTAFGTDWGRSHPNHPGESIFDLWLDPRGHSELPGGVAVERVINPLSGILNTNGSRPGQPAYCNGTDFNCLWNPSVGNSYSAIAGTGWTNPNNCIDSASNECVYSGTTKATLFLRINNIGPNANYIDTNVSGYERLLDSERLLILQAYGEGASPADREIEAAITIDGVNAYSDWKTITLTASAADYSFPSASPTIPKAGFQDWLAGSTPPISNYHRGTPQGTLIADGTDTVTLPQNFGAFPTSSQETSSPLFKTFLVAGSKIRIGVTDTNACTGGTEYTITSVNAQFSLTVNTGGSGISAGTKNWCAPNYGFLIRKKSTSSDAIHIQYLNVQDFSSWNPRYDQSTVRRFSELPSPDGSGNLGYVFMDNDTQAWVSKDNGETRFIEGSNIPEWPGGTTPWSTTGQNTTNSSDPTQFYGNPANLPTEFRLHFSNQWQANPTPTLNMHDACSNIVTPVPNPCTERLSMFGAYTVQDLMHDLDSRMDTAKFADCTFKTKLDHYQGISCASSNQDSLQWMGVIDLNRKIANYIPGNAATNPIFALAYTGDPGFMYSRVHFISYVGPHAGQVSLKYGRQDQTTPLKGEGPWRMDIVSNLALNATSDIHSCGPNDWGGVNCSTIQVTSEPFDPDPAAGETGAAGEYGPVGVGQPLYAAPCNTIHGFSGGDTCWDTNKFSNVEVMRIIAKSGSAPNITLEVARGLGGLGTHSFSSGYRVFTGTLNYNNTVFETDTPTIWDWTNFPNGGANLVNGGVVMPGFDFSHNCVSSKFIVGNANGTLAAYSNVTPLSIIGNADATSPLELSFAKKWGQYYCCTVEIYVACNATDYPDNDGRFKMAIDGAPVYLRGPASESDIHGFFKTSGKTYIWQSDRLRKPVTTEWAYILQKVLPLQVTYGYHSLLNVSGPNCSLSDTSADWYKFGVVYKAGECVAGSKPHEIYVVLPFEPSTIPSSECGGFPGNEYKIADLPSASSWNGCRANIKDGANSTDATTGGGTHKHLVKSNGSAWVYDQAGYTGCASQFQRENLDLCVFHVSPHADGPTQYVFGLDSTSRRGQNNRKLYTFANLKFGAAQAPKIFPDGKWLGNNMFPWGHNRVRPSQLYQKIPMTPSEDSIDRNSWVPLPIQVGGGPTGTSFAQIEFGYKNYGSDRATGRLFCTERQENCIATSLTVPQPYGFEAGPSLTAKGLENVRSSCPGNNCVSCTSGTCSLTNHGFGNDTKIFGPSEVNVTDADTFVIEGSSFTGSFNPQWFHEDSPFNFGLDGCTIDGMSGNGVLIAVRCHDEHHLQTGNRVFISGVAGNTAANGNWKVTVTGLATFTLDSSNGNGTYTSGGTVVPGGEPCSGGCTISVPTKSNQVMYYRIKYFNSAGSVIGVTRPEALVTK